MIGVDGSSSMLTEAYGASDGSPSILYLLQDMRSFELYGTVGATVCCLDSMNYLLSEEDVKKTLRGVHNYLDPNGLFIFDVNTPNKFVNTYGSNAYVLEDELEEDGTPIAVYCGWQNRFDPESGICDFYLSLFEETEEGSYLRSDEHQQERCYSMDTLKRLLDECSMEFLGAYGDYNFTEATEQDERWYIVARAIKK